MAWGAISDGCHRTLEAWDMQRPMMYCSMRLTWSPAGNSKPALEYIHELSQLTLPLINRLIRPLSERIGQRMPRLQLGLECRL